jgi:hypothetical protein
MSSILWPYVSTNPYDVGMAGLFVVLWLGIGACLLHLRYAAPRSGMWGYYVPAVGSFLGLCAIVSVIFLIGLVFLAWLRIPSDFWPIWILCYVVSALCVFWALPLPAVALVGWALVGRWRKQLSGRAVFLACACVAALFVDVAIYVALHVSL